jgi:hypothetical protein
MGIFERSLTGKMLTYFVYAALFPVNDRPNLPHSRRLVYFKKELISGGVSRAELELIISSLCLSLAERGSLLQPILDIDGLRQDKQHGMSWLQYQVELLMEEWIWRISIPCPAWKWN